MLSNVSKVIENGSVDKASALAFFSELAYPFAQVARTNGLVPGKKLEAALAGLVKEGRHVRT